MPELEGEDARPEPVLKPLDAWWTVLLIDPLAVRLVAFVQRFPAITATQLTVAAHLLGLVSAAGFAGGLLVLSAVLFEVRFVLDCADGKLARIRRTSSTSGAFLDYIGDYLVVGANMAAIALHLFWREDLAVLAAVGLPAAFLAHIAAGQARMEQAVAAGVEHEPSNERVVPGSYRRWMAEHRMRSLPGRVDAEHILLFLAPVLSVLLDAPVLLTASAWGAAGYFAYRTARLTFSGYRIAMNRDRGRADGEAHQGRW